jgi:hypothetical protein
MDEQLNPKLSKISVERILTWTFFLVIIAVVIITFFKYFVFRDYIIQAEADCDPYTEECFIWKCDPKTTSGEEKCTGDPEKDIWFYKLVKKKAYLIPDCDPDKDENCNALSCEGIDKENCEEILCNDKTKEEGIECNDPVAYSIANPEEEENEDSVDAEECDPESDENCEESGEECAPDDEECLNAEASGEGGDESKGELNTNSTGVESADN